MPLISVIVPVYNVKPYLRRCVNSILGQTFADFELILVDDGSPDNCGAICDEYAAKDQRIHVIHQENGGLSAARNAGIDWAFANSDSKWLSFVDSDDWVHPCFLEYLYRAVCESGEKISACFLQKSSGIGSFEDVPFQTKQKVWDEFYCTSWANGVVACNKLYLKELFDGMRYPVGRIHEDEYLTYRILEKAKVVACVDAELYYYFENPDGITKQEFSIRKLDAVIALREQCRFARENGYQEFYLDRMKARMGRLADYIQRCSISNGMSSTDQKKAIAVLRRELRIVLIQEGKRIAPLQKSGWIYELAFPKISLLYWTCHGILKKMKRMV